MHDVSWAHPEVHIAASVLDREGLVQGEVLVIGPCAVDFRVPAVCNEARDRIFAALASRFGDESLTVFQPDASRLPGVPFSRQDGEGSRVRLQEGRDIEIGSGNVFTF